MKLAVPTGAWQRDWIRRYGGAPDTAVTVRYVQTPSVFGDLRTPSDRPAMPGASSLAELTDEQLAMLARQNGFAGTTTIEGAQATWHHEIDFQPSGGGADIGRIEPAGPGKMFEHALDGAYIESWSALGGDRGPYFATRVTRGGRVDQLFAVAGDHFIYARARSIALPEADSLTDAIAKTHATREQIIAYLDCELSYGSTRNWQIERSTLPWQEGKRLAMVDQITVDANGQPAAQPDAHQTWSFPVQTFSTAELHEMFPR
jgi:hypothetical protein